MTSKLCRFGIAMMWLVLASCSDQNHFQHPRSTPPLGFLSFGSHEEFETTVNNISSMTEQELDAWETQHAFVSYRSVLKQAYQEWEAVTTENEQLLFLKKYEDVLSWRDQTLVPLIDIHLYQSIVNREGIYETNGYLNKIVGDYIVTVKKTARHPLNTITSIDESTRRALRDKGIRIHKFTDSSSDIPSGRTGATCTTYERASYFHNESNCRNDREVFISARSYLTFSTTWEGDRRQPRVEIKVWGKYRTATWCNWREYSTLLSYRNVSFTIKAWELQNGVAVETDFTRTLPDYSPLNDRISLAWDQPIGSPVLNQTITASPFTTLHAEGASRGTAGNWAVIDCQ